MKMSMKMTTLKVSLVPFVRCFVVIQAFCLRNERNPSAVRRVAAKCWYRQLPKKTQRKWKILNEALMDTTMRNTTNRVIQGTTWRGVLTMNAFATSSFD
ncbi:hypothetical protein DD238_008270 [Peronospora effusa]|uniref:Secreted protein n=1 Tax=Peronospora effusa TaxID=542832 RepID=A0A3M6V995_9STRA|nr:hypothetical protein DD238_008270 [Peronospora effusa]RQM11614.1 hypothetical protein DD237_004558 [Peronospora effusa]